MIKESDKDRLIRLQEVKRLTGLGRSSIYSLLSQGLFPTAVKIGLRSVAWSEASIQDWILNKLKKGRNQN